MQEDVLPALRGFDETEAVGVVPGFEGAVEAHGRNYLTDATNNVPISNCAKNQTRTTEDVASYSNHRKQL